MRAAPRPTPLPRHDAHRAASSGISAASVSWCAGRSARSVFLRQHARQCDAWHIGIESGIERPSLRGGFFHSNTVQCPPPRFSGVRSPSLSPSWSSPCGRRRNGPHGDWATNRNLVSRGSSFGAALRSTCPRLSSGGGTPTTPMRRAFLSRGPVSRHRADSSRSRSPSACRCGVRARQRTWLLMAQHAGRRRVKCVRPDCLVPPVSCWAGSGGNISAMMGRSMCCASRRRAAARASAW